MNLSLMLSKLRAEKTAVDTTIAALEALLAKQEKHAFRHAESTIRKASKPPLVGGKPKSAESAAARAR